MIMEMMAAKHCRKSSLQAWLLSVETDTIGILNTKEGQPSKT